MDRDPGDFEPTPDDGQPPSDEDARIDALLASLPPCPGLPSTDEEIAEALAQARADVAAGRVYSHAVVSGWLRTWGKSGRKTFKDWLAARNG